MFKENLQIVCVYKNDIGDYIERTFWTNELILGEHINFLAIAPGYKHVGYKYPEVKQ